jgi:UDPglucose--hexose-1-phosphate uridylyltransferase|tara:strand:+ start:12431 stop:13372 length:942 start_codon:yes stop_codon:yes gene_type:complete
MGILRKDYILDRWVYYATERKKRPREFKEDHTVNTKTCFFCPENEHLTPPEIGRVKEKNTWRIRWFPNKFPVVELKENVRIKTKNKFIKEGKTYGMHEIIAETRDHKKQLSDLSIEHIKEIFDVYVSRIKALSKLKDIKYVTVFRNQGSSAGTSLIHSHTQVAALPILPKDVMNEIKAAKKFRRCPHCNIIRLESKSKRKIVANKSTVAFAPFASRFNFEAWIFPKRHVKSITAMYDHELYDMASALKKILVKLKKLNVSHNFFLHYAPQGHDLHFHIEITPRLAKWGGFELSTGAIINSVTPEDAARFYRGL